jgi:hypothetical protein
MKRFVEGIECWQSTLVPECLEDWICEDNPVRVLDAFAEELDLAELKFCGVEPRQPAALVPSPRRYSGSTSTAISIGFSRADGLSARAAQRRGHVAHRSTLSLITKQLLISAKTMGLRSASLRPVRRALPTDGPVDESERCDRIDGSKFKAVKNRDKNYTRAKMERSLARINRSVARYLSQLDTADLQEPLEALAAKVAHLNRSLPNSRASCRAGKRSRRRCSPHLISSFL